MAWLRERLPPDAIICNGAGNYRRSGSTATTASALSARSSRRPRARWATACRRRCWPSGSIPIGSSSPSPATADFLMNGQEFATAVQYELPIIVIVVDNGMYGTIRMHQEREYPGRVVGDRAARTRTSRPCQSLRRPWRARRAHRRVRARVRARARLGQAGDPALHRRSRGAHAGHDTGVRRGPCFAEGAPSRRMNYAIRRPRPLDSVVQQPDRMQ